MMGFVFVLLSFSLASAGSCSDDQTIMRLYSATNSHVSAWDQNVASYVEEICYADIFGTAYSGTSPHVCTGLNRVVSLSSSSNAHASTTSDAVYNYNVCYGDLECVYDSSAGNACSNGGKIVARLFSNSNAHVSYASGSYPVKVCCNSIGVYWTDMNGNRISNAEIGDTVKLVARGVSSGNFEIKEDDVVLDDNIRTGASAIVGNAVGSDWVGVWTINNADMAKTPGDWDEFYFEIGGKVSEYLEIDQVGSDDIMNVSIITPYCGQYFDEGVVSNIVVSTSDTDDLITGTVKVNGIEKNFSNAGISFAHTFGSPGNFQVVAEVLNDRGKKSRAISNIMVLDKNAGSYVDGEYVAACIKEPKDFTNIHGSVVDFDASTTLGIRASGGSFVEIRPTQGGVFSWYWTFYPQNIKRNLLNTSNASAYRFTATFPIAGDNSASLRVEI